MALNRLKNQLNRKNGKKGERKRMGSLNGGSVKIRGVTGIFFFFFFYYEATQNDVVLGITK
jgi:hypothetical protein